MGAGAGNARRSSQGTGAELGAEYWASVGARQTALFIQPTAPGGGAGGAEIELLARLHLTKSRAFVEPALIHLGAEGNVINVGTLGGNWSECCVGVGICEVHAKPSHAAVAPARADSTAFVVGHAGEQRGTRVLASAVVPATEARLAVVLVQILVADGIDAEGVPVDAV